MSTNGTNGHANGLKKRPRPGPTTADVETAAYEGQAAGLSILPPREDGTKAPLAEMVGGERTWKHRETTRATLAEIGGWYARGRHGVGVVCGLVSGGREGFSLNCLDFDDRPTYDHFRELAAACGLAEVLERAEAGYLERSPRDGAHVFARVEGRWPTTKLAERPDPTDPHKRTTLIETKCEGGYIVLAPSHGPVHPSGKPYVRVRGALGTIAEAGPDEWRALCDLAASLDEVPAVPVPGPTASMSRAEGADGAAPGEAFEASVTWEELLSGHGWTLAFRRGDTAYWRRPGKGLGCSATTNHGGSGFFYCFSTSTEFEARRSYTKFGVYAALEHGGDFRLAARSLAAQGFGTRRRIAKIAKNQVGAEPTPNSGNFGNSAPYPEIPEAWPEPDLGEPTPADPFPLDCLPVPVADFVFAGSDNLACPADFLGATALGVASGAIGRSFALELKPGWIETCALYIAPVGDPGLAKTPALAAGSKPLWGISRELLNDHVSGERPRRLAVDDTTVEAMAPIMKDNPRGLVMVRDELTALFASHNQYKGGKGADRQFYLSAWSGSPVSVDRKNNPDGVPIYIPHPFLSIVGGITPGMLSELAEAKGRDDGLLDRILFVMPDPVRVRWNPLGFPPVLRDGWDEIVRRLWRVEMVREESGRERPFVVRFAADAQELYGEWFDQLSEETEAEDFPPHLRGPWAKFRAYGARLALVLDRLFRACDPGHDPDHCVSLDSLARAIRLMGYLKSQTRRARGAIHGGYGENADARALLRWIARCRKAEFSERDARHNFRYRFPTDGPELGQALRWLEARYCIRPKPLPERQGPGRPPSAIYEVNPALLSPATIAIEESNS